MDDITRVVHVLLQYQILLKIYHWQTRSYARHVASDSLHENISKNIDLIVETLQGEQNKRIKFTPSCKIDLQNMTDKSMLPFLKEFREWVDSDLIATFPKSSFLVNIKDEIITDINKTLYLFTLE
jgi:hypothetical protein